ncbi:Glycosyltransferase SypH [Candidatus Enterovibrio escicola]|uniref:Glycosyltransferase SypH n=2 Tax=Candidatus Enterovibrio escicola TaxID=1927127 RepID=A0A2A5T1K1_9GAMM|nr:Glycosyltransferase SypH [Candidatus Enterovibrio escacola]
MYQLQTSMNTITDIYGANMLQRSKKIWLVLDSSGFGGIESHVEQLALGLSNAHNRVSVVFLKDYGHHPLESRLLFSGLNCIMLDGCITSLRYFLKKETPDVIHTHGYKAGILMRPISRLMGITCASTFHSGEHKDGKLQWYDLLDRYTAFLANHVYAISSPILSTIPCTAKLTDNFVSIQSLSPSFGNQVAFVGRLSKEKGPERFLHFAKIFPLIDFHLYGDGPMRKQLERNGPKNLKFHGLQVEMRNIWPHIGLLVVPSRSEGLPMSALEAMAHGIPVVAFNVGSLDQLIQHGMNGWLVKQSDLTSMASVIHHWNESNENQRAQWRKDAITTIQERYSTEKVVPQLLEDYATSAK